MKANMRATCMCHGTHCQDMHAATACDQPERHTDRYKGLTGSEGDGLMTGFDSTHADLLLHRVSGLEDAPLVLVHQDVPENESGMRLQLH